MSGATDTAAKPVPAAPAAGGESPPAKAKPPILLYVVGALVVVAVFGAAAWMLAPRFLGSPASAPPEHSPEAPVKATVPLGSVVVNLGPPESRHYLKVGIELGVTAAKAVKEIEEKKAQILDLIITVLSTTPIETLGSGDGRAELKKTLLERFQDELKLEAVSRVYFTEFLIQ
jgi:flagellar FliL protein